MQKRVAVVTGGVGGLGTAICRTLADAGRTVIAADLSPSAERLAEFHEQMADRDVRFVEVDVADHDACSVFVRNIQDECGSLDILINNAGITRDATLRKMALEQWQQVIDVNLGGAFHMSRHAIEGMQARGFGRIVNISSISGQTGNFGQTNYAAAKAGLHGFSMSLAREVAAKGITVNSIAPGYVETPMTRAMPPEVRARTVASIPIGRIGDPNDIARAVGFLTDDAASYITGAMLPVNGGLFMSF